MNKRKLLRFEYCQKMTIISGYEDVVIDPSKFPELDGKTNEEIGDWIMQNKNNLGLKIYTDTNPRTPEYYPEKNNENSQNAEYEISPKDEADYQEDDVFYQMIGPVNNTARYENGVEYSDEQFLNFVREEETETE
jgi:hypothetical protein